MLHTIYHTILRIVLTLAIVHSLGSFGMGGGETVDNTHAVSYPSDAPHGEISGGVFNSYFTNFLGEKCDPGKVIKGFGTGGQIECVTNKGSGDGIGGWENVPLTDTNDFDIQCEYRFVVNHNDSFIYAEQVYSRYIIMKASSIGSFGSVNKSTKNKYGYREIGNSVNYRGHNADVTKIQKRCGGSSSGVSVDSNIKVASGQNEIGPSRSTNLKVIDLADYGFSEAGEEPHIIVSEHNYNYYAYDGNTMDASYCGFTKLSKLKFRVTCWASPDNSGGVVASSFDWIAIQNGAGNATGGTGTAYITCTNENSDGDGIDDKPECVEAATTGSNNKDVIGTENYIPFSCNYSSSLVAKSVFSRVSNMWYVWYGGRMVQCEDGSVKIANLKAPISPETPWKKNNTNTYYESGSVGIGTTTPQTTLDIKSTLSPTYLRLNTPITANAGIQIYNHLGAGWSLGKRGVTHNDDFVINYDITNNTKLINALTIKKDGKVGIGTENPSEKLEIAGKRDSLLNLVNTDNTRKWNYIQFFNTNSIDSNNRTWWLGQVNDNASPIGKFAIGSGPWINSKTHITIGSGGNVGIGTTKPQAKLDVNNGDIKLTKANNEWGLFWAENYSNLNKHSVFLGTKARGDLLNKTYPIKNDILVSFLGRDAIDVFSGKAGGASMEVRASENFSRLNKGTSLYFNTTKNKTNQSATRMVIANDGNVGIGTVNPNQKLHIVGNMNVNGRIMGGGASNLHIDAERSDRDVYLGWLTNRNVYLKNSVIVTSDKRLKKEIKPINNSLNKILKLNGVYYKWKKDKTKKEQIGVIAQEVEKVFPQAVSESEDGYKAVKYSTLVAPLIEAVKEQQNTIEFLRKEIELLKVENKEIQSLKKENKSYKTRLDTLEKRIQSLEGLQK